MAKHGAGSAAAPAERRTRHQSMEIPEVEIFEHGFEVVVFPFWFRDKFVPARLPDRLQVPPRIFTIEITPVALRIHFGNWLAVELAHQQVGQSFENGRRGGLKHIADAHEQRALREPNGAVGVSERFELDDNPRRLGSGLQFFENPQEQVSRRFKQEGALNPHTSKYNVS